MLNVLGGSQRTCHGVSRRRVLQVGGAGLFGLHLTKTLAAEQIAVLRPARAKSVIFLFLFGGPSQLETFDMKPKAPSKVRGPFKPIACRTPGLLISEHLPRSAAISDKYCVIRTMTHPYNDHSGAGHYIQTGQRWHVPIGGGFNATQRDWPSISSVVEYLAQRSGPRRSGALPATLYLPNRLGHLQNASLTRPGGYGGWLGKAYDPLATDIRKKSDKDNPYFRDCDDEELDFRIKGLAPPAEMTLDRLNRRHSLLEQFDAQRRAAEADPRLAMFDEFQQRAFSLVTSESIRSAMDIRREPPKLRDRYGRHLFGQSTLLARRLVERGARFVTVGWDCCDGYSWDSHRSSKYLQNHLIPGLDTALSALLADLDDRGLLDETLVVCLGEMGRTPQANGSWGRGHWSTLFPAVVAGAGIRGGVAYGLSDKDAAYPVERATKPEDLAATIYHALGIDPEMRVMNSQGRPTPVVPGGRPLVELFG